MNRSKALPLILVLLLIFPAMAVAKRQVGKETVDWVGRRVSVFDDVITRSKAAGINTTRLEKIASEGRKADSEHKVAQARNHTENMTVASQRMARLSNNFTEELLRIRADQDKRDVERSLAILKDGVSQTESTIAVLETGGANLAGQRTKLGNVKGRIGAAERQYTSKNYRLAEKESATALDELSLLISELRPSIEMQNITVGN